MVDRLSREHRSWNMGQIKGRDTAPEMVVRSMLHRMGYRFRVHRKDLPGKPDIVLPKHGVALLVHGCFWHRHSGCHYAYTPKSRVEFWNRKFRRNIERDREVRTELQRLGWRVVVVWECEIGSPEQLRTRLTRLLARAGVSPPGDPLSVRKQADEPARYRQILRRT